MTTENHDDDFARVAPLEADAAPTGSTAPDNEAQSSPAPDERAVQRAAQERRDHIAGLRMLADWLEAHPEIKAPISPCLLTRVDTREEVAAAARLGGWTKEYNGDYFSLKRSFNDVVFDLFTDRTEVCRKVVTGTRVVAATPEHVEEVFEWVCEEPLLAGGR